MKIAILHYHRIGGSGIVAYEIGRTMAEEKGHEVHFVGLDAPFRFFQRHSKNLNFHKIFVKEYPVFDFQPYTLALASQLSEIIERYGIDIIHSHYALPHAVGAILARDILASKVKCVTTLHGTDITVVGSHPSMKNITRYAIEKSDAVTAVSNYLTKTTEAMLELKSKKIQTIYNFVNPKDFHPGLKIENLCRSKTGKCVMVHVSNLREVKLPMDVLRIFNGIVKKSNVPYELWIVGEGPMENEMRKLVLQYGLDEQVKFLGIRSNLGNLIATAELMILPSKSESFGLVALEAMACGVPVLASRAGGLPEVIDDQVDGLLFEPGNHDEATYKALELFEDPHAQRKMREACLKKATGKFNMTKVIAEYEQLYQSL